MAPAADPRRSGLAQAGLADTLALLARVVLPTLAKGVLVRRPRVVRLAERLDLDAGAVRCLQGLRRRYGEGPLLLPIPVRRHAVLLAARDVHRVLAGTPEPFAAGTAEKHAALAKFEPRVSLVSHPPERAARRHLSDVALESDRPVHSAAVALVALVEREAAGLLAAAGPTLTWAAFTAAWHAAVRTAVLGRRARDDHALTDMLSRLRAAGNWAFLHPGRPVLRRRFRARLADHLAAAERGSLAARIAGREEGAPLDQVAQWLFAFDAAGIATYRVLALIAAHPDALRRAATEAAGRSDPTGSGFIRACAMESVRLWPTTPAVLRATTRAVDWPDGAASGGTIPEGTQILIYVPFLHRDDERLPDAHRFTPDRWLGGGADRPWPFIPFSAGPGTCPAHHLVPLLGSAMIAAILRTRHVRLARPERLRPDRPIPGTLDPFTLAFDLQPRAAG